MNTRRCTPRCVFILAWILAGTAARGQEDLHELITKQWYVTPFEVRSAAIAEGLERSDAESRARALSGIVLLAIEDLAATRSRFDSGAVAVHFWDDNAEVTKQAMRAYSALVPDDRDVETAVIGRAVAGGGPLKAEEYIRYLRTEITTDAARDWLLGLSAQPISPAKYSAAEALVLGLAEPPQSLLPDVMELVRSNEYFCAPNLVMHLPKFGDAASAYLGELKELRGVLVEQGRLPPRERSVVMSSDPRFPLEVLDEAISSLEQAL